MFEANLHDYVTTIPKNSFGQLLTETCFSKFETHGPLIKVKGHIMIIYFSQIRTPR
jgi:hypothetical protein